MDALMNGSDEIGRATNGENFFTGIDLLATFGQGNKALHRCIELNERKVLIRVNFDQVACDLAAVVKGDDYFA